MKFHFVALWVLLLKLSSCSYMDTDYTQWVNPFIGTLHEGHCFPGATVPMGMVQVSPESCTTHYEGYEMDHVAGYQYTDSLISGFTQTHLNGVGCPSMSDILLMPYCDRDIKGIKRIDFCSEYDKRSEIAKPGYYRVFLSRNKVDVELTATEHAAYHYYHFENPHSARLLIDLQYGVSWDITKIHDNIIEATQQFEDDKTLSGYRKAKEWTSRKLYYVIKFNRDVIDKMQLGPIDNKDEKAPRYVLSFNMGNFTSLEVAIGISTTSIDAAKRNLNAEIKDWGTFNLIRDAAKEKWNKILSKIILSGDEDKRISFYTSMYHLYIQPNNIADVEGTYRAENDTVYKSASGKFYSTFSLWDTFRAAHPMYTILSPELVGDFMESLMDSYTHKLIDENNQAEKNKYLPRWQLWGKETHTMVGNHAVPVLVDALLKGLTPSTYSNQDVYQAIKTTVTEPHYRNHVDLINKYGYIPFDDQIRTFDDGRETVSRLLEGVYDDYCASVLADKLGYKEDASFLLNRSEFYKNVFNKEHGFMLGRNAKGEFKKEINPSEVVGEWLPASDYTEGNSWHYLFHVLHNVPGLIELVGGEKLFVSKLDSMFYSASSPEVKSLAWNIYGTLGQYWHGNEPCHHVPYLYKYTKQDYKTDAIIRYLVDEFYKNAPDGLKGNDDCGQMSAWYMFTSMGFYPVNPVGGEFILGAPQFPFLEIKLNNGNTFKIIAENLSEKNMFVNNIKLNGNQLDRFFLTYDEIMAGGELSFTMESRKDVDELFQFYVNN